MLLVKMAGEIVCAVGAGGAALVAADTNGAVVAGGIGSMFVFGGLLVRELLKSQKIPWQIIETLRDDLHYSEWEKQRLRYTYGERPTDPGPYSSRRKEDTNA